MATVDGTGVMARRHHRRTDNGRARKRSRRIADAAFVVQCRVVRVSVPGGVDPGRDESGTPSGVDKGDVIIETTVDGDGVVDAAGVMVAALPLQSEEECREANLWEDDSDGDGKY